MDLDYNEKNKKKINKIKKEEINASKTGEQDILDKAGNKGNLSLKNLQKGNNSLNLNKVETEKGNINTVEENSNKNQTLEEKMDNQLDNYANEVIEYLEEEKPMILKELTIKQIKNKKKDLKKKVTSIDVEENIDIKAFPTETKPNEILEVKDKIFKNNKNTVIETDIYYDGKLFNKDRHQLITYPSIVKYRCKNYRKNEKILNTTYCLALIKRKIDQNKYYFILEQDHSKECLEGEIINLKIQTNLIGNYNDYIDKCMNFLNSTEYYNRKDFTTKLQEIYNENKYNFRLKENTIKNIIGRWKLTSLRFTKYSAIENKYNKKGELILYDYLNTIIYTSSKKKPISAEYFIWSSDPIISRIRKSQHLFIDATFHHPEYYSQLLIIIFKDLISSEYYPGFFILMSNKSEILYDLIFKSVKRLISQQNIYDLSFKTITTDTEIALINAVKNNFDKATRIGCWFHLSQDLIREARTIGLLNSKNKKIDINTTYEIITQLSLLPLNYKGDMEYLKNNLNLILLQYPDIYNYLVNYFLECKLKYFQDGSYDYSKFPPDIRSNSILERYNKLIKNELGEKRTCNWVVFLNFINKEIERINEKLGKNENLNVLYLEKQTKFGKLKFNFTKKEEKINKQINKKSIKDGWLLQRFNNCRYNAFITLFYFTYSSFIKELKEDNTNKLLIELNELVLKLVDDTNDKNYYEIIIFLQKNKFDANNFLIDEIINEDDDEKKAELIEKMNTNLNIDTTSSGYINQLFSVFKNNQDFCLKEKKYSECILCGRKNIEIIDESQPFLYVNSNNISLKNIFNILLEECKEKYIYDCPCRINEKEDLLCNKVKYSIESYPFYLNVLFDMSFKDLEKYKESIFKIAEDIIVLNMNKKYKLKGIISLPSYNHYICIIFNPMGKYIDDSFKANNIYYHDGNANNGKICSLNIEEDWKVLGIPYILAYELIRN